MGEGLTGYGNDDGDTLLWWIGGGYIGVWGVRHVGLVRYGWWDTVTIGDRNLGLDG